jgi:hypothetical protein
MKTGLRIFIVFLLAATSLALLFIGLMARLTPSEGPPQISDYLIFLGLPIAFPLIGFVISEKDKEKLFCIATEVVVVVITIWWLWHVAKFF